MNELTVFNYGESPIRTMQQNGEIWWVLADVCKVLEISNSRDAASRLDDDEKDGVGITDTMGRQQTATVINEPGLYSLILRSNKPEAKAFKRWVTHEVIPAIRKNGAYKSNTTDKREIAELILSCKTAAAVKGILALYNVQPSPLPPFHVPQNANNSVSLFLKDSLSVNLTVNPCKEVYKTYTTFCSLNGLVPSTLANFSKEIHKQTGLTVLRHRVNGILVGFYQLR